MSRIITVSGWIAALSGSTNPQQVFTFENGRERQWVLKGYVSQRHAATEFIGAHLARAIGLSVPEHQPLYLTADLIGDTPELQHAGFLEGFHLGIAFEDGFDLEALLDSEVIEQRVLARLDVPDAAQQAVAVVVADTTLCNNDHHPGSANHPPQVSGNVSNIYFAETPTGYELRALDFGAAFNSSQWGEDSGAEWPTEVMGTMKYFFRRGWLPTELTGMQERLESCYVRLNNLNLSAIVQEASTLLPQEWRVSNPTAGTGATQGNLSFADWEDLVRRLERHRSATPSTIAVKFPHVAKAMKRVDAL